MVSEAEIAEARRKALRNGEEDPVAVAQRYLNVYRQMHIFTPEKKSEFDQSLLNLSPISIGIISSLPGGLTFQDYIDEIMTNAGREKVSKTNKEIDVPETLPQTNMPDSNQPIVQPQPIAVPVMSGPAKVSIDKDFAGEFAKIMGGIIDKQTEIQKESLAKIAQDLGKTQMFIAQKLEDGKEIRQEEISNLCKIIAQSHTALSSSLSVIGQKIANQNTENALIQTQPYERKAEDDAKLLDMFTKSQERIMSEILARMPQAVGVGNVNVTTAPAPVRSVEEDARLVEMITKSQERMMADMFEKISQISDKSDSKASDRKAEDDARLLEMITKSQESLIFSLVEKLPRLSNEQSADIPVVASSTRSIEDDARLVEMITKSQEKLISSFMDKIPQAQDSVKVIPSVSTRSVEDDARLVEMITKSQENMLKSLIENNVLASQNLSQKEVLPRTDVSSQEQEEIVDNQYTEDEIINTYQDYLHQSYEPVQYIENDNISDTDFGELPPVEEFTNIEEDQLIESQSDREMVEDFSNKDEIITTTSEKKKKKKKKKKNKKIAEDVNFGEQPENYINESNSQISFKEDVVTEEENNNYNNEWLDLPETEDVVFDIQTIENEDKNNPKADSGVNEDISWDFSTVEEKNDFGINEDISWDSSTVEEKADLSINENISWGFSAIEEKADLEEIKGDAEDNSSEYFGDAGWEYVEAIDDNAKIYSSDSFNQKVVPIENISDFKRARVYLKNIPQIYDEVNDEEFEDPYKNSILKRLK